LPQTGRINDRANIPRRSWSKDKQTHFSTKSEAYFYLIPF